MVDVDKDALYRPSGDVVARVIEGELIIVPLVAGIGDMEDELFSVNETGKEIWEKLDGKTTLVQIIHALADHYRVSPGELEHDVMGFLSELLRRKMIVDARTALATS